MIEPFAAMLAGGHPNSLGRTVEVVDAVLAAPDRMAELLDCYASAEEVVRLRASSALKRLCRADEALTLAHFDRIVAELGRLSQPSARWTLAQLALWLQDDLEHDQAMQMTELLKQNLDLCNDWIVLNHTIATLTAWAEDDAELRAWLLPRLEKRARDPRKSVAKRAREARGALVDL